jgi:hypothetical protein
MDSKAMEIRTKIRNWLISEGYETNKAYGMGIVHTVGIAGDMFVLVKPSFPWGKYARVIAVSPTEVSDYEIDSPFMDNNWMIQNTFRYKTKTELKSILQKLVIPEYGRWEEE